MIESSERVVAIIQARMTSTRLPGKVLADLAGRPMLEQQLRRLAKAATVDEVVVATTDLPTDDPVCALAERLGIAVFRGSEHDVLGRYVGAAAAHKADVVLRITADCPLLDAAVVDNVAMAVLSDPSCDYASNVIERSYPQGLDVEAIRRGVLERINEVATSAMAREHVTWHIVREAPESFSIRNVRAGDDNSDLRWTVDTQTDLELIRRIYGELDLGETAKTYREVLGHVLADPSLRRANQHIEQRHE